MSAEAFLFKLKKEALQIIGYWDFFVIEEAIEVSKESGN